MGKKFCLEIQDKITELGFDCHLGFSFIFFFLKILSSQFQKYLDENKN